MWAFAFVGLKQYEYNRQDGETGPMKFFIHALLVLFFVGNIYYYINSERSYIVPNTTMVEETKK